MNLLSMLKNLIKGGKQTKPADDKGGRTKAACNFLGQNRDIKQVSSYGVYSHPPIGSNWIIFSSRANSDDLHGIGNDYKNRPKNLLEGEVVLQNLLTGAFIKFDAVGNIEVFTDKDIIATAANITASALTNITATAGVDATLTAGTNIAVNAPNILVNGANTTITSSTNVIINAPSVVTNCATATVNATAAVNTIAPLVDVTAADIYLNGTVKINGSLDLNNIIMEDHAHSNGGNPPQNP